MLNFIGGGLGIVFGLLLAWRRGGNRLDLAQYAAVFAVIGFMIGTFIMLVVPAPS